MKVHFQKTGGFLITYFHSNTLYIEPRYIFSFNIILYSKYIIKQNIKIHYFIIYIYKKINNFWKRELVCCCREGKKGEQTYIHRLLHAMVRAMSEHGWRGIYPSVCLWFLQLNLHKLKNWCWERRGDRAGKEI